MISTFHSFSSTKKVAFNAAFFVLATLAYVFSQARIHAASFQVAPVRANLSASEKTSVFEFHNTADEEVSVQVNVKKWLQENGLDKFENTRDVVAVPAVFKMAPGKKQIVRVALLKPQESEQELSYRVFFTELPNSAKKETMKVKMRLRISVPIFIAPAVELKPTLVMSDLDTSAKTVFISNPSNQHVQVLQFLMQTPTEQLSSQGAYLLPGQSRTFKLDIPDGATITSLSADTDTAGSVTYADSP